MCCCEYQFSSTYNICTGTVSAPDILDFIEPKLANADLHILSGTSERSPVTTIQTILSRLTLARSLRKLLRFAASQGSGPTCLHSFRIKL